MSEKLQKLPVYIAVPSCREGYGIAPLLESLANQSDLKDVHLFVLVNNPKADAEKGTGTYKSNILTYALLKVFEAGWKIKFKGKHLSKPDDLAVHVVDSFSRSKAQKTMNVGKARRMLMQKIEKVHKDKFSDAIVITLDADEYVSNELVELLRDAYTQEWPDGMLELPLQTTIPENAPLKEKLNAVKIKQFYNLQRTYEKILRSLNATTDRRVLELLKYSICTSPSLGGGCSSFLLSSYRKSEGYKDLAGGEDMLLSFDMYRKGAKPLPIGINKTLIFTPLRSSDRTDKDHGMGQRIIKQMQYFQPLKEDLLIGKYIKKMQDLVKEDLSGKKLSKFLQRAGFERELADIIMRNKEAFLSFNPEANIKLDEGIYWGRFAVGKHVIEKEMKDLDELINEMSRALDFALQKHKSIIQGVAAQYINEKEMDLPSAKQILDNTQAFFDKFCYSVPASEREILLFIVQSGVLSYCADLLTSIVYYYQYLKRIKDKEQDIKYLNPNENLQNEYSALHDAFEISLHKAVFELLNGFNLAHAILKQIEYALSPYKNKFPKELSRLKKAIIYSKRALNTSS